ncbi:NYN domain-containing protein [bacterium]|nr:NYN domain-containing protein [bacterium]MBU1752688.1 NYN domain-containing protein [bacterium]
MWLIIDGNNVIKSSAKTAPLKGKPFEEERDRFVELLISYQKKIGEQITVVFDHGEKSAQFKEGVEIIYSGREAIADDVIKAIVSRNVDSNITVASSDREVINYVKKMGQKTMGAQQIRKNLGLSSSG